MKKLFFAIVALAVMFAQSCSKEEFETQTPEYKLVVNMEKSSFSGDTRAPRTEWEGGDEVVVVFNGDVREDKVARYLKLTYTLASKSWSSEWVGTTLQEVAAKETKTCVASYHSLGVNNVYIDNDYDLRIIATWNISGELSNLGGCLLMCDNGTFTVSQDGIVTLNISMKPACVQYTIRNISVDDDALWKLKISKEGKTSTQEVYLGTVAGANNSIAEMSTNPGYMVGHRSEDGVAFFGAEFPNPRLGTYTFTLTNGEDVYTRNFNIQSVIRDGQAIIMDGPFDNNGNRNEDWSKVE